MKKLNLMIWLSVMVFIAGACKDDDDDNQDDVTNAVTDKDRNFILNAADGGMFEVMAGQMAVTKGDSMYNMVMTDSMSVRSFGQMMVTDHTTANNELKALADERQVTIPTTLTTAKQQKIDSLTAASGQAFNQMYIKMMVTSHQETINLFQTESTGGDDTEMKTWASGKLPTLQHHLEMAQMMQDSIQ
ncbi:DUF4142 domain-containing protein [Dyadobacter sp. CY356]|uniref:DUF4142 domain-containing protein n=1 Tax=Dyadobacter sp. CY356 TaxID=2906442 RepID=UPI001F45AF57|nr:DUF4142 domain-containing protein [Dyadobacter sp. CY356]MCF0054525.1 DUF4142 domain-containing protein [Dyadobacter sp. CY356]